LSPHFPIGYTDISRDFTQPMWLAMQIFPSALNSIGPVLALALLAACASSPNVIANRAPDFDIANYRTFDFMQPLSTDNGNVRSLVSMNMMAAAERELETAGLTRVTENPDLLVNFLASTRQTLSSRPSSGVSMGVRGGRYGTWGGYSVGVSTSTSNVVEQTEGTLAIDIIDASRNMLVWEGALSGRVTSGVRENLETAIDKAVTDILAEFP
jgi:hypothetical protein